MEKLFSTKVSLSLIKVPLSLAVVMLCFLYSSGQAPQAVSYQAIVRNSQGQAIVSHAIGIKFNIRQGSGSGTIVYSETQATTSDPFGGIAVALGQGSATTGNLASIDWGIGPYYNEVLVDVAGGTNYVSMGASQLMSVPYALYAGTSSSLTTPSVNDYSVRINGTAITDSTLNFVHVSNGTFITKTNYQFNTQGGISVAGLTQALQSAYVYTDDTLGQGTIYTDEPELRGRIYVIQGATPGGIPNHAGEIYYVPLNAQPVTVNNFTHTNGQPAWISFGPQQSYQLLPNNPVVTGFNLPATFTVKYER